MAPPRKTEPLVRQLIVDFLTANDGWWLQKEIVQAVNRSSGAVCMAVGSLVLESQLEELAPTKGMRGMRYRVMKAGRVAPLYQPPEGVDTWPLASALGGFTYIGEQPWQTI